VIQFCSSPTNIPDGISTFSLSVHHSGFTAFAAQGGLISAPACF